MTQTTRPPAPNDQTFGATIKDALRRLEDQGYTGSFRVQGPADIECLQCHGGNDPEDVRLDALWRIEGVSDPADEQAIAALICPKCEAKGTLILTYGPQASAQDGAVLRHLNDRRSRHDGTTPRP